MDPKPVNVEAPPRTCETCGHQQLVPADSPTPDPPCEQCGGALLETIF